MPIKAPRPSRKLEKPKAAKAAFDAPELSSPGDDLSKLLAERFFELLDEGQWWGATLDGSVGADARDALDRLAASGARCACVNGRAGVAGYFAILAHPADAARWPTRRVSQAVGTGRRPPAEAFGGAFFPMSRADFPTMPRVFADNEASVRAMRERETLGATCPDPATTGGKAKRL